LHFDPQIAKICRAATFIQEEVIVKRLPCFFILSWLIFILASPNRVSGRSNFPQHLTAELGLKAQNSAYVMQSSGGGGGGSFDAAERKSAAGSSFTYQLLKQTVSLWSDGRGDLTLQRKLRNTDITNWSNTTWYFDWSPGNYSNIRAWDKDGPLDFTTSLSGTRIYVTVDFRRLIQPGQSYDFYIAITIANMASGSGNTWNAYWYTIPGFPVQEFIQGVTFASNSTFQYISPTPTTQNLNYLEWRATNTPSNWTQTINVDYILSNVVTVPLFLQTDANWAGSIYGNPLNDQDNGTIGDYGCWMTSAAMILEYWGQRNSPSFHTNPALLNTWLRTHDGYDGSNFVVHKAIERYAVENNIPVHYHNAVGKNDAILDDYLRSGNPVILGVTNQWGGHFVLATGKTTMNGQSTYSINDPIYGETTLLEKYSNNYSKIILYSNSPADPRTLRISAHSPVELLVTDPLGRKLGFDPTSNTTWNEIPNATYTVDEISANGANLPPLQDKYLEIIAPLDGNYTVDVIGTGQGAYEIDTFASDWTGKISKKVNTGLADFGSLDTEVTNFSSYSGISDNADIQIKIAGINMDDYHISPQSSIRKSYRGVDSGPVWIASTNVVSFLAAERVIYKVNDLNTSFSELMAFPNHQLDTTYWLPWYNNIGLDTQLRFANVSNSVATVHVYIGEDEMTGSPFTLDPGASTRRSFPGVDDGPVKIESNVAIVAAERVIYKVNGVATSFSEMMALPNEGLDNKYWLPWYNNIGLDTQLRFANVSTSTATVRVFIGGEEMEGSPFTLAPGASIRKSFPGVDGGPVEIRSTQNIVAAERVIYKVGGVNTSFTELMSLPDSQLDTTYWLPWYNNIGLNSQLRFANVSSSTANVHVYIQGVEMIGSPFMLDPGESIRQSFAGIDDGPVQVVSNVPIVAAERVIYRVSGMNTSFSEIMGLPDSQLDTTYWLPWYNNIGLDSQLRFGVP
jgi:uncharacterized protein YcfL